MASVEQLSIDSLCRQCGHTVQLLDGVHDGCHDEKCMIMKLACHVSFVHAYIYIYIYMYIIIVGNICRRSWLVYLTCTW